jgi:hypothetical protein
VADVLHDVSDLAPDATHRAPAPFISGDFIHGTFVVQARIAREVAGSLLDLAFERFGLALPFSAIPGEPLTPLQLTSSARSFNLLCPMPSTIRMPRTRTSAT